MKKMFAGVFGALFLFFAAAAGCTSAGASDDTGGSQNSQSGSETVLPPIDKDKLAEVIPTVYDNTEVVTAAETEAGDVEAWQAQVFTKNGGNNDEVTKNAIIKSPWHTLTINDTAVRGYNPPFGKSPPSLPRGGPAARLPLLARCRGRVGIGSLCEAGL